MKAKLSKLVVGVGYRLDDENGNLIAATLLGSKTKLSIKNCETIERGYDLEELAIDYANGELSKEFTSKVGNFYGFSSSYIEGFKKALELNKDKVFTLEDMKNFIQFLKLKYNARQFYIGKDNEDMVYEFTQSLQHPTEIAVEVEMECLDPNCDGVNRKGDCISTGKPKLDENNCIILKRI
jgi:hypothetical protein